MASAYSYTRTLIPKFSTINVSTQFVLLAVLAISTTYILYGAYRKHKLLDKNGNHIPAGPAGFPIIGSHPYLVRNPEFALDRWAKRYGPLYSVWLGNNLFIVVSDPNIAKDLMVTNGAIFSSWKDMFVKTKHIFAGRGVTTTPYDNTWKKHRRIATSWINKAAIDGYAKVIDHEATALVHNLYVYGKAKGQPVDPRKHAGRCSLNTMLAITYSISTDSIDHPLVASGLRMSREFMNCTGPMSNLVDFVPLLQHLPNSMTTRGMNLHKDLVKTYGGMLREVEARMKRGEDVPDCLAKTLVEIRGKESLDFLDMAILCSVFMIAGVESTASIMQWFLALIPSHPHVQQKAHEELDRVVGRDRLPTIEDQQDLPYIRAIIKEVERCYNPFWLGTPHVSTEDFTYQNQFIPKGTPVVMNTYTMHHDPERHSDPHTFNPERYINETTLTPESVNRANLSRGDPLFVGLLRSTSAAWENNVRKPRRLGSSTSAKQLSR
ncbi:cytochrome P450 [Macrolepiota fuliginosa MF-IS2]|uniref:Cytochrome P450 n=1 Tax=Macrolepiota fuliginosa MF-IS2 TaxID=1400762 RepID=A0A9P5X165_9AGAR|nr:cytochrome P450 [Macrolepiota fuliginosa MF-IS2]